jgi:hypothetical protein
LSGNISPATMAELTLYLIMRLKTSSMQHYKVTDEGSIDQISTINVEWMKQLSTDFNCILDAYPKKPAVSKEILHWAEASTDRSISVASAAVFGDCASSPRYSE